MMGHSVLAYQFVAGLVDQLKSILVGMEGTFEELLAIAQLEEAKAQEMTSQKVTLNPRKHVPACTHINEEPEACLSHSRWDHQAT